MAIVVAGFSSACASANVRPSRGQPPVVTVTVSAHPITSAPPPEPPLPSASIPPGGQALTIASNGAYLVLHIGQHRRVRLVPADVPGSFDPLTASRPTVVTISNETGGYPGNGPLEATITGTADGTTQLTTQSDLGCFHSSPPCAPPQSGWVLNVTVQS